jgi:hypothetical protein
VHHLVSRLLRTIALKTLGLVRDFPRMHACFVVSTQCVRPAARRGSIGGAAVFSGRDSVLKRQTGSGRNVDTNVYSGYFGDIGRCELMLVMFVFVRILLPQVVRLSRMPQVVQCRAVSVVPL